jgi:hypothetical protein
LGFGSIRIKPYIAAKPPEFGQQSFHTPFYKSSSNNAFIITMTPAEEIANFASHFNFDIPKSLFSS